MAISFKGAHFPPDILLMGVRWYVAYPLSTRHVEELMLERGVHVDHSTINQWVVKYRPQLEERVASALACRHVTTSGAGDMPSDYCPGTPQSCE
jgi:transposase-like protein